MRGLTITLEAEQQYLALYEAPTTPLDILLVLGAMTSRLGSSTCAVKMGMLSHGRADPDRQRIHSFKDGGGDANAEKSTRHSKIRPSKHETFARS